MNNSPMSILKYDKEELQLRANYSVIESTDYYAVKINLLIGNSQKPIQLGYYKHEPTPSKEQLDKDITDFIITSIRKVLNRQMYGDSND